jgi:hypothetical protein
VSSQQPAEAQPSSSSSNPPDEIDEMDDDRYRPIRCLPKPPKSTSDCQAGLRRACEEMQRQFGSPCDTIALEWALLRRNDPNLPANPTLDEIGDMYLFDKELTFRDFQDRMDQTAKLIREKAGPPRHDFPTFLTGVPKETPNTAFLNELIHEQSQIPLRKKKKGGAAAAAARGSANYKSNYGGGADVLASSSRPIIPHPTQTFGSGSMEESPYGCPSSYKPSKRFYRGGAENEQRSEETNAAAGAVENDGSDMENDF